MRCVLAVQFRLITVAGTHHPRVPAVGHARRHAHIVHCCQLPVRRAHRRQGRPSAPPTPTHAPQLIPERSKYTLAAMLAAYALVFYAYFAHVRSWGGVRCDGAQKASTTLLYFGLVLLGCGGFVVLQLLRACDAVLLCAFTGCRYETKSLKGFVLLALGGVAGLLGLLSVYYGCWTCLTVRPLHAIPTADSSQFGTWATEGIWYYAADLAFACIPPRVAPTARAACCSSWASCWCRGRRASRAPRRRVPAPRPSRRSSADWRLEQTLLRTKSLRSHASDGVPEPRGHAALWRRFKARLNPDCAGSGPRALLRPPAMYSRLDLGPCCGCA